TLQERHLVLRAQTGDREAFDALLRGVAPPLLRYVRGVVGESALADDVLQETLILIVRKLTWLSDPALFRPWAYRIASREAFRALRRRHIPVALEDVPSADYEPPDPWQRERLLASLDRLTPASRAVITLHYFEELPLSDVAAVLDLSLGTVKSRLSYGLARLRKENFS
ncbi:MAG TPA: RNA polymerase sigma factor, partial [Thermoanaerobaculia bacterium]|nr:RNA polymerase sigma factor [Thermoanaerobaculia bacterium]